MRFAKYFLFVVIFSSTLLLSGCSGPNPDKNVQLSDMKITNSYSSDGQDQTQTQSDTQTQLTAPPQKLETKGTMPNGVKKLEDFEKIQAKTVTITTNKGEITFEIYTDKVPLTAQNFLNLAKSGFYNGVVFHRVIADFMIQTGDPLSKDPSMQSAWGTGGPGYTIADEFAPDLKHDGPGVVSMANAGPNTGGSQFFITHLATPWLDGKHAIFGKVTSGMDVVNSIAQGDKIISVSYK